MFRVIIWGLGQEYNKYYNLIDCLEKEEKLSVVCVSAKDPDYYVCGNYRYISPTRIVDEIFDAVLVASSSKFLEIVSEGIKIGIPEYKLIPIRLLEIPKIDLKEYMKLKKSDISIVAQNCWGGLTYNYLGLKFSSPFINLSVSEGDMLKLMGNFRHYIESEIQYSSMKYNKHSGSYYPTATLDDVEIKFIHYADFEDAKLKWDRRKKRINYDNLFFMAFSDNLKYAKRFAEDGTQNKVCFVPFETKTNSLFTLKTNGKKAFFETVNSYACGKYYSYDIIKLLTRNMN